MTKTFAIVCLLILLPITVASAIVYELGTQTITQTVKNKPNYYATTTSNIDSNPDIGTHTNLNATQSIPDSITDTITEQNTVATATLLLPIDSFTSTRTDWTRVGTSPYLSAIDYSSNYVSAAKNRYDIGDFGFVDSAKTSETITNVQIQLYAKQTLPSNSLEVYVWTGSTWISLGSNVIDTSWSWANWTATGNLNSWSKIDTAKIYIRTSTSAGLYEVDAARISVQYQPPANYQIDLETQFSGVDFHETNRELCIYSSGVSSEGLRVDVWNGAWNTLIANLAVGWNNVTVNSYLDSSTFYIRFRGTVETADMTQNSWQIDSLLIHSYS